MVSSCNKITVQVRSLLLASSFLIWLTACEKADDKANLVRSDESQATFLVDSAGGEGELLNTDTHSLWQIPISSSFSFMVCLKDRANGESLRGQRFLVEKGEDGTQITPDQPSDINGCIKWREEVPFNFFAKRSARLPLQRYILGQGIYTGRVEVKLAINPWALGSHSRDGGEAVVFMRDQILPQSQLAKPDRMQSVLNGDMHGSADLWIQSLDVTSIRRKSYSDGQVIDLSFEIKPKIRVQNMNGGVEFFELKSGSFDVVAHLIATETGSGQSERTLLTPDKLQASARVIDGSMIITTRTSLERRVSFGNLELVLKLIPKGIGSLNSLNEFEGIFELGDVHELGRGPNGLLSLACRNSESSCSMIQALDNTTNFDKLRAEGYGLKNEPFIFTNLKLRFASVQPGETATQRNVMYTASTCIRDRWTGQDMAETPFLIEYLDDKGQPIPGRSQTRATNEEGCLNWDSTIFHKYYQPERLFWHEVRISLVSGVKKSLRFALNPWDDKFTFGWDEREFSKEFIQNVQNRKKIPSRFFLSHFGYHAIRFLYNIDRFMELEVKKTVLMELYPRVLRYSGIINARQQTESLRDGIYLMKIAIQKDYLDPADRGRLIKNKRDNIPSAMIEELGGAVSRKEYITTSTQLVRVVDGDIIHPVELTMRDLRLMRVRSNFLIQLETIDEKLVQAHGVLRDQFRKDLEALAAKRAHLNELTPEDREIFLRQSAEKRKQKLESAFFVLKERLESSQPSLDNMDLMLEDDVMAPLKSALDTNDFTEVKFPSNEDFDLNHFIEKDSGLEKRSFVGPVIYLSNGYSDSVRATDNLDEARCNEPDPADLTRKGLAAQSSEAKPPLALQSNEKIMSSAAPLDEESETAYKWEELKLFLANEKDIAGSRQNNAYRFSKYYGSLKHLCSKSVDDIINREKEMNQFYRENMPALASVYNFVSLHNLDFVSLGEERMTKLDTQCTGSVASCLQTTSERSIQTQSLLNYLKYDAEARLRSHAPWAKDDQLEKLGRMNSKKGLAPAVLPEVVFSPIGSSTSNYTMCALLAGRIEERLQSATEDVRYKSWFNWLLASPIRTPGYVTELIFRDCMLSTYSDDSALWVEDKLRVNETGKYTFLGGLQLNLNVGESFSLGRSNSWGTSFNLMDTIDGPMVVGGAAIGAMIGGPPGALIGGGIGIAANQVADMLKPLSISRSSSMSNSDGTSVSQSTYLVAQIARFNLEITKYQTCRVARLNPEHALRMTTESLDLDPKLAELVARGLFICSDEIHKNPVKVEESYFYFTQHFTEGDMLDQADLYNHPWLLAMRGVREFATFVSFTNSQEVLNLSNFTKGVFTPEKRPLGWPLAHMEKTYRKMLPTFPGLYTIVDSTEKNTNYPLAERLSTVDEDINSEVHCKLNAEGYCEK